MAAIVRVSHRIAAHSRQPAKATTTRVNMGTSGIAGPTEDAGAEYSNGAR